MSVYTTGDEKRDLAYQKIKELIQLLEEIPDSWNDFNNEFIEDLEDNIIPQLRKIKRKLS